MIDAIAQMSGVRTLCETTKTVHGQLDQLHVEVRSSCVLVVEEGRLLGIFTERDVVRLSAQQCSLPNLTMQAIMTEAVVTLHEADLTDLFFAVNLLQQYHIRHLPILDEQERLVGLVTHESLRQTSRPVDLLRLRLVSEVMTSAVVCADRESSMLAVAQQMAAHRVSSVMIVQPDSSIAPLNIPVGIVTERVIVQFQALGLNLEVCQAQAVMSTPIFTVKLDDSLWAVQQLMEQRLIRRLAVTGKQGELLGIVTQSSLLQALNPLELYKLAEVLEAKVVRLEAEKVQLLETRTAALEQQIEVRTIALKSQAEREQLVAVIATQIRSSLSLQTILETTVTQVRQLLGCDRVNIWQFEADWQTIVVAESTDSTLSLVGERINDACLKQDQTELYRQGRTRIVSDIYTTAMADCHREMLIRLQTRAKVLVPLLCGDKLWGLLNVTESQHARHWQPEEIELLQALSVQLAIALQQATTHQKLQLELVERQQVEARLRQSEAKSRAILAAIPDLMFRVGADGIYRGYVTTHYHLDVVSHDPLGQAMSDVLPAELAERHLHYMQQALETGELQVYEHQVQVRGQLRDEEVRVIKSGEDEVLFMIRDISEQQAALRERTGLNNSCTNSIKTSKPKSQHAQPNSKSGEAELQQLSERLALSLKSGAIGCWEWHLAENTILWDERMYELYGVTESANPQVVYDLWVKGLHPDDRITVEILLHQAVLGQAEYDTEFRVIHPDGSSHFIKAYGVVVRDDQGTPQQMIGVNFDISDRKNAEQTIRQQADREALLREITQRIRQSLDLQTIFDTACQEIRQMLQADRVGIFKFYPESHFDDGEFVSEAVVEGFPSVVAIRVHDHCFGENYASLYAKGRSYVVDDIYHSGMTTCHTDILAQFQVRANLIMPLLCGKALWGLLCIHQCATTRHWQQSEIDFTQQLANQLAIAIQQADLYEQKQTELLVRQQAEAKIALQLQRQQALGSIVQQIRESLDIKEILATVTQQVQVMLHSDRVIVFQLLSNGNSRIVEEAVSRPFPALKDRYWENEVWAQTILDYYWQGKPRIVPDVMNDHWTNCLLAYSLEGQIRSKIVAPILQDVHDRENHRWVAPGATNQLWGVLVVHACQEKRVWQNSEAQLLQQIANQLAIAIQQANLFELLQQELTERQQAETKLTESNQQLARSNQELARATRLKDEFLANMSHELRTPLNAILGMTEGLEEQVFGMVNEQQRKALQTVERSGAHLLELINDILDLAKIEAGQIALDCTATSVAHLCQSSMAFIKQQALQKRIQLDIKLPPHLPDLLLDERRMRQVLINLLSNAVKFTPQGGRITLEVSQQQSESRLPSAPADGSQESQDNVASSAWMLLSVIDTGIGIAPENIKQLFQPFIQIDSALNRQYQGTGLGLALVKQIV